jgi:hypothetical protein
MWFSVAWFLAGPVIPTNVVASDLEQAINELLLSYPELETLIDDRVYPIVRPPRSAIPCLTYTVTRNEEERILAGGTGRHDATFDLSAWAFEFPVAKAIGDAAIERLVGASRAEVSGVYFRRIAHGDVIDSHEFEPGTGRNTGVFHRSVDFRCNYRLV